MTQPPELIMIAHADAALRSTGNAMMSVADGVDTDSLNAILTRYGASVAPLFGVSEERILRDAARFPNAAKVADHALYYRVNASREDLAAIAEQLRSHPAVDGAYVKPPPELPVITSPDAVADAAPALTPDFAARQAFWGPAPGGIDVGAAWNLPGGRGAGVQIIDMEGAWRFTHEDLRQNAGGLVGGPALGGEFLDHGTAVIGVVGADDNGFGVTGIAPDATISGVSLSGVGTASAIRAAADRLSAGDIVVIEIHRPGPRFGLAERDDQRGYIAIEWWPDDLAAIRYAAFTRNLIVVEAAGNGAEDLDDVLYEMPAAGFPSQWRNPFRRGDDDSGAVVVGAGAPPPGTHGRDWGPDRSKLDFSNFGSPINAQGWGREVTTCGYGDLQGGANADLWYTDTFNGTSSATPMIVGVLACLQGRRRFAGRPLLDYGDARQLLATTGSPQQATSGLSMPRIGNRPDLRALTQVEESKGAKEAQEAKTLKDGKEGLKESKEKESKDTTKEGDKGHKDSAKDGGKDHKDHEKSPHEEIASAPPSATGSDENVTDRLAGLAQEVPTLSHFIDPELRPDLTTSALNQEPDVSATNSAALGAQLRRRAEEAKSAKDRKDVDKHVER